MKECILVGGGSSVREGIQLGLWDKIKGKDIWSINYAFMTMPYLPSRECWVDVTFFKNNIDKLQELSKQGVPCYTKKHDKYALLSEITCYETTREAKDAEVKMYIGRLGLSGFFSLSLAIKEGYDLIYLLGYDFGSVTDTNQTHYYQNELKVISTGVGKPELYHEPNKIREEIKDFELFLINKAKIINISPKSKIPYFEKIDYPEFFKRLENENK